MGSFNAKRVKPVIDVAIAQFKSFSLCARRWTPPEVALKVYQSLIKRKVC
jgi:hypothetical protein